MEEADQLCDRVAIMDHGKILALDTPAGLKQSIGADTIVTRADHRRRRPARRAAGQRRRGGHPHPGDRTAGWSCTCKGSERLVPRIVVAAERGGFELVDLSISEPSLETVFINLTGKELRD